MPPSRLKFRPAVAVVIEIIPVAEAQVGSVTANSGAVGAPGKGTILIFADGAEIHPAEFVTEKSYDPGRSPVIVVLDPAPAFAPGLIVQLPAGKVV